MGSSGHFLNHSNRKRKQDNGWPVFIFLSLVNENRNGRGKTPTCLYVVLVYIATELDRKKNWHYMEEIIH